MAVSPQVASVSTDRIYTKVALRLLPLLFICYITAYLDRINVGFAKLQMQSDLNLSDSVYGFASGIFFFGYLLFEVPSNLLLEKIGARLWIARIMISWGIISGMTLFVNSAASFSRLTVFAWVRRGRLFPGHHSLSDLLVPIELAGTDRRLVYDGYRRDWNDR